MKRFGILAVAATSLLCLAPSEADACQEVAGAATSLVTNQTSAGLGASFVTTAIKNGFGYPEDYIYYMWGYNSPPSWVYFDAITAGATYNGIDNVFNQVSNINDIAAGQIVAIDAVTGYSGHAMVVVGAATEVWPPLKPILTGTKQYAVKIADATTSVHGNNINFPDSRTGTSNLNGTGYIRVYADATTGSLTGYGYTWSVTSSTTGYYTPDVRPIAFGEFTACDPLGVNP
ncbi:hypothetical protein [Polyangium aurulentum]|uniref:hypothetical protein n=1 Tax=Polyangium aurulentum TaxID=2567896 RepID=UPI0010AE82A8|nr:hypothetical protein [Polyangium aurulentum]UQA59065.1 hypothetical protein E8A73_000650 [Polyangium aurulentum]